MDRAEPSEALKANIAWSVGLENPTYLLSSTQLDAFRKGKSITEEVDIKATPVKPKKELRIKLGPLQITHKNYRQKTNTSRS